MSFFSTWQRYFCKELLKTFFLFLFCFYILYALIDYAGHTSSLQSHHSKFRFFEIARYYFHDLSRRADIIVAFGLLISTIRTVFLFNTRKELVALMAGGISLKKLLTPFIGIGVVFSLLLFVNEEWAQPKAHSHIKKIEDRHIREKNRLKNKSGLESHVHHLNLHDGSLLVFGEFIQENAIFEDVYWMRSGKKIYRIKQLKYVPQGSIGNQVDVLVRAPSGFFHSAEFFNEHNFNDLVIDIEHLADSAVLSEHLSLSDLYQKLEPIETIRSEKQAQVASSFYKKLVLPLLPLIATLMPLSFCVHFSRTSSSFKVYGLCLFCLTALYLTTDAAEVLAKRQLIAPIALIIPTLSALFYGFLRFAMIR